MARIRYSGFLPTFAPATSFVVAIVCGAAAFLVGCGSDDARKPPQKSAPVSGNEESWLTEIPLGPVPRATKKHSQADDPYFMPDIMGTGAAFLDFDGDGRLDIILVDGTWSSGERPASMHIQLWRQETELQFVNVSESAGLGDMPGYAIGVAAADIDNDGHVDLYVAGFGGDRLFLNRGDGTFADVSALIEAPNRRWGTAVAFCDYDRDGWLDLCVVTYLDYFPGSHCDDGSGRADYCGPNSFKGTVTRLYRNLGGPNEQGILFADVTVAAGLAMQPGPGLGICFRDFDGDSRPDLFVANDMSPNALWMQQPDGTFHNEAAIRGVAVDRFGTAEASMGVVCNDLNGDGEDDLFITTLRGEMNMLLLGKGGGLFSDETSGSGLGPPSLEYTGFGTVAFDLENDGDLDLFVVNGRVQRAPALGTARINSFWNDYAEPNQIFVNDGQGHFTERSEVGGLFTRSVEVARALVYGDVDDDGDYDLLATYSNGPARVFRNDAPRMGNWLMVRAATRGTNRQALGARIEVQAGSLQLHREVNPFSSYLSSHDPRVHFGLGAQEHYDRLTVFWPDGAIEDFPAGEVNRSVVLLRGTGSLRKEPSP